MIFPGFIGPTYQSRSLIADAEQCVNLYPEIVESGAGKNKVVLYGTPGLTLFSNSLTWVIGGTVYNVYPMAMKSAWNNGTQQQETFIVGTIAGPYGGAGRMLMLYRVDSTGFFHSTTFTLPDDIVAQQTPPQAAFLASNGSQLLIGLKMGDQNISSLMWCYDMVHGTLSQVTQWQSGLPLTGLDYLDGFFIATTNNAIYVSAYGDGTTWNALTYINESDEPDSIIGLKVDHRLVWVLGRTRIEAYYNAGGQDFPFQRIPQGVMEVGCFCAATIATQDESLFWVGISRDGGIGVYRNNGYQPVRISNHYIESFISSLSLQQDHIATSGPSSYACYGQAGYAAWVGMRAYAYRDAGHLFYVLNFGGTSQVGPSYNASGLNNANDPVTTLVYDATTGMWHERRSTVGTNPTRHLGNLYAFSSSGHHILSDYRNNVLYYLSRNYKSDNGTPIQRWRIAPHISNENKRVRYHKFTLDCEVGTETQDSSPENSTQQTLTLSWSDDGGQTWGSNHTLVVGQWGNTKARAIWRRLGRSRDRVFKVFTQDAMNIAWINAYLEMTEDNT